MDSLSESNNDVVFPTEMHMNPEQLDLLENNFILNFDAETSEEASVTWGGFLWIKSPAF